QVPIPTTAVRTPDINLSASVPVHAPTGALHSNVDCRCCASGNSPLSIAIPRAQSCGNLGADRAPYATALRIVEFYSYAIARLMAQATSLPVTKPCASPPLGSIMYLLLSRL